MEWWGWIGWAVGLLGAVFGVRGEIRAHRAEQRAQRVEELTPWDDPVHHSGDLFTIRNSSTRDVIVTALKADPPTGE